MKQTTLSSYSACALASIAILFTFSCATDNAQYCETTVDCGVNQICSRNACIASPVYDATQPDGSPVDSANPVIACPEETHQCTPAPPAGWSGPTLRINAIVGETLTTCPDEFSLDESLLIHGTLFASGSCSCSCREALSFTCTPGSIQGRSGPLELTTCFSECTGDFCTKQVLSPNSCSSISSGVRSHNLWRFQPGQVTGGTCGTPLVTSRLDDPLLAEQSRLCQAQIVPGQCESDDQCIAIPPTSFSEPMCITQAGAHECPSDSLYTERTFMFEELDDQRSCSSCRCSVGIGDSCGEINSYSDDDGCNFPLPLPLGSCEERPNLISGRVEYTKDTNHLCEASTQNPDIEGQVEKQGQTTVCCLP